MPRGRPYHPITQGKIERYHKSRNNLTTEDVYTGRGQTVFIPRRRIKQITLAKRGRLYYQPRTA